MKNKEQLKTVCFTDTIALFGNSQIQSGTRYTLYYWPERGVEVVENSGGPKRVRFFPLTQVRFLEFFDEILGK